MKIITEKGVKISFLVSTILFISYFTFIPHPSLGIGTGMGGINFNILTGMQLDFSMGAIINTLGNIFLFVPFGVALTLLCKGKNKRMKVVLNGTYLSVMIEIIQFTMPNRWTDINDVLLNTFGTWIGYAIFIMGSALFVKKAKNQNFEMRTEKEV